MTVRRVLIAAPVVVMVILLQSYFWVPSYEQQTRGNPERLSNYITGSIGDASLINPILSADSASSQIESMVFEGLIDRDKDLRLRGRLATAWDISEIATFLVNPTAVIPGAAAPLSATETAERLLRAVANRHPEDALLDQTLANIQEISVVPAQEGTVTHRLPGPAAQGDSATSAVTVTVTLSPPPTIRLRLHRVDQDLFSNLEKILGDAYFTGHHTAGYLTAAPELNPEEMVQVARQLLPATEHNPVIEFLLRPGVRFHDGHEFSAEDVKFTYDAIMDPRNLSPRTSDYEPVKTVTVDGPLKVRVTYKRLYSPAISTWAMGILPAHRLNDAALAKEARRQGKDPATFTLRQSDFNRHPIGCGPFVFSEWKSDQYIRLARFDDYWEGPANYRGYVVRVIPDLLTQEMEFYAGTLDHYGVPPYQVKRLKEDPRFQSFSGTAFGYTYIGYNLRRAPFDDPRVRRALGMAIDARQIIDYVLYGQAETITGPFPKQTDFYNSNVPALPYDPAGAAALLKSAGWMPNAAGILEKEGRPLQFTLITNSGNDLRKAILAIAQDAWKRIGVDVRTDLLEWSVFLQERVNKLDFDALVLGWQMGIDPDLYQIWHSSQTGPFQLNFVGFRNAAADDLIIKIRQEYDLAKQIDYCHRLHAIIADEQPYTFLYVSNWTAVLDRRIAIKETDAAGNTRYRRIEPTKTGNYAFDFNQWIKLPTPPVFEP
ncbi:MAG: ABC transporter substrate-binding protein [Pseudomonadota bacterium]